MEEIIMAFKFDRVIIGLNKGLLEYNGDGTYSYFYKEKSVWYQCENLKREELIHLPYITQEQINLIK